MMLPVFADIRDVPFGFHSCTECFDSIKEDLTVKQTELKKWIEDDHTARMKEAMEREGVTPKDIHIPRNTNRDKKCSIM